jgi:hypothetical protein
VSGEREAVAAALRDRMERGSSGRWIADYDEEPETLADAALAALAATAPAHDEAAAAWDEAVQAMAWALGNGSPEEALRYVREHNPYRAAPIAAEQVHAARAVADRDAARIAGQVRASGEGREG